MVYRLQFALVSVNELAIAPPLAAITFQFSWNFLTRKMPQHWKIGPQPRVISLKTDRSGKIARCELASSQQLAPTATRREPIDRDMVLNSSRG